MQVKCTADLACQVCPEVTNLDTHSSNLNSDQKRKEALLVLLMAVTTTMVLNSMVEESPSTAFPNLTAGL